ncbi:MAG: OmpH family outer membrane protein [Deltaproteobacteria bacterium]|nr:OmpH family outer membrane protein [Nannocystaceae bacterium]
MQRLPRLALPVLAALGVAAFAPGRTARAAETETLQKVAVVDVQRCLLDTKEGKKAKGELEKAFAKGQTKIDKKAGELQKRMQDLQAKASMLSENELRKRQEEVMRGQQELEQLGYELQEDVAEKEALLTEKIYKNVSTIVKQLALEDGVQVVLVRSEMTVIYVDPRLDLTNRVIVRYDKEHP